MGISYYPMLAQNSSIVKGYYLTHEGDSIVGQINTSNTSAYQLRFRCPPDQNWQLLKPKDVAKARGEDGFSVVTQDVRNEDTLIMVFVQKILQGYCELYEVDITNLSTTYFVGKAGQERIIKLNKLSFLPQSEVFLGEHFYQYSHKGLQCNSASLVRYFTKINNICAAKAGEKPVFLKKVKPRFGIGFNASYYAIQPQSSSEWLLSGNFRKIYHPGGSIFVRTDIIPAFLLF